VTAADVRDLVTRLSAAFELERDALATLDAATGDGDHGAGMARGFGRARDAVAELDGADGDVGAVLVAAGKGLMAGVGGASGALFASLFLDLGKVAAGAHALHAEHLAEGAPQAVATIRRRGRSEPGDKTMLDALIPAAEALRAHADAPLDEALGAAAHAARAGAEATRAMPARHGRARYATDAGVGHLDPGAVSMALVFETWHAAARGGPA
jgi:phosphoenolpyruvate---glycerone phosphotransferase subunit DhaL